jgi:catechol 2,3-dioxygenase-like lactoylglutathione lyase family enzyme
MIDIRKDLPPLGHVGYVVEDVEACAALYAKILGIESFRVYEFTPMRAWASGAPLSPCRLKIGIGQLKNETKIELIQPVEGDTPHERFLRKNGPGLHHMAFYSRQYEEWHDYFQGTGAEFVFEAEAEDDVVGYRRSLYAQVPGLTGLIEITEIAWKRK